MSKTILIRALLVLSLLGFTAYGVRTILNSENQLQLNRVELKSTTSELKSLEQQFDNLNKQYEAKDADTKKLDQERQKLQDELEQAKRDLQAKRAEEARVARLKASQTVYAAEAPTAPSGDCVTEIMKYSWNTDVAINVARAESGLNPGALNNNPSTGDYSVGCFQVNLYGANARNRPSEAQLKNAAVNVQWAYNNYVGNGNSFIGQWGVCRYISCY